MTPREVNALLAYAQAAHDARLKQDPQDRMVRATSWARKLEHVSVAEAQAAVDDFYSLAGGDPIGLADLLAACPVRSSSWAGNVTEQRLARERGELTS